MQLYRRGGQKATRIMFTAYFRMGLWLFNWFLKSFLSYCGSIIGFGIFSDIHRKHKTPVLGNAIPVLGVKPKRGWYVLRWFFKIDLTYVQPHHWKTLRESSPLMSMPLAFWFHTQYRYSIPKNGGSVIVFLAILSACDKLFQWGFFKLCFYSLSRKAISDAVTMESMTGIKFFHLDAKAL